MVVLEDLDGESNFAPLWFHHLSNLDEEDKDIEDLFENFEGPDEVFPYVLSLKDEGNTCFKLKEFGNAYIIYNKAIKSFCIVASAICDGDVLACENNPLFRDLIISLTLNLVACAIKLNNWSEAVDYCSLILEADAKNVKALFRKGLALKNLDRLEEAYEALSKARSLEPKNKEIVAEIDELQRVFSQGPIEEDLGSNFGSQSHKTMPEMSELKAEHDAQHLDAIEKGYESKSKMRSEVKQLHHEGDEVPRRSIANIEVDMTNVSDSGKLYEDCKDHATAELVSGVDHLKNNFNCPVGLGSGLPPRKEPSKDEVIKDTTMEVKDDIKSNKMETAGQQFSISDCSSSITEAEMLSNQCNDEGISPQNFEEPIYRFQNWKKQGFNMSISKSNYLLLTQGKSIKLYNAKFSSFMEVRIANKLEKDAHVHIQEMTGTIHCESHYTLPTMKQEHIDSDEVLSEVGSCVTFENSQPAVCDDASSNNQSHSSFIFSSTSNNKARKKGYITKCHDLPRVPVKQTKRRKLQFTTNVSSFSTNFDCECRFKVGMKRKSAHLLPMDFYHQPRKKTAPFVFSMHQCVSCPCSCTNICNAGIASNKDIGWRY